MIKYIFVLEMITTDHDLDTYTKKKSFKELNRKLPYAVHCLRCKSIDTFVNLFIS